MPKIKSPETFAPNQVLTANALQNHVDGSAPLPGFISEQIAIQSGVLASTDTVLVHDISINELRKATVANIMATGAQVTTNAIVGTSTNNTTITPGSGGGITLAGNVTVSGTQSVTGKLSAEGTSAMKIPAGTTAQRPGTPVLGDIRYNTTDTRAEIYNGTEWKELGSSPFDASGGNIILAPSKTTATASFTSTNLGKNITVTLGGHNFTVGQVVELISSAQPSFNGEYVITSANSGSFSFIRPSAELTNVSGIACTVRKSGNHKIHIFKSSGTFTTGSEDGFVEVLLVGGGGGPDYTPRWNGKGGGSGGVLHRKQILLKKNTTYTVTVGAGGTWSGGDTQGTAGSSSAIYVSGQTATSFLWAGGGAVANGGESGASGTNSDGATPFLGTTFGDWANWGSAGAGAGSAQSCWPRNGSDSTTSAYTNRMWPAGYICDITNVRVMYGMSGGDSTCVKTFDDTLRVAMKFTGDETKGFVDIGHGATSHGSVFDDTTGRYQQGRPGIAIIRYNHKLQ